MGGWVGKSAAECVRTWKIGAVPLLPRARPTDIGPPRRRGAARRWLLAGSRQPPSAPWPSRCLRVPQAPGGERLLLPDGKRHVQGRTKSCTRHQTQPTQLPCSSPCGAVCVCMAPALLLLRLPISLLAHSAARLPSDQVSRFGCDEPAVPECCPHGPSYWYRSRGGGVVMAQPLRECVL